MQWWTNYLKEKNNNNKKKKKKKKKKNFLYIKLIQVLVYKTTTLNSEMKRNLTDCFLPNCHFILLDMNDQLQANRQLPAYLESSFSFLWVMKQHNGYNIHHENMPM